MRHHTDLEPQPYYECEFHQDDPPDAPRRYPCPACDFEDQWRLHDYAMALLALAWLTFQSGVYLLFMLGLVLVLTQNYGYTPDDAILPAAGYSFIVFIFWILVLFPTLFNLVAEVGERTWRGIWGQSL